MSGREWERAKSLNFIELSSIQVENLIDFRQKCVYEIKSNRMSSMES